jgi:hypothetical protein
MILLPALGAVLFTAVVIGAVAKHLISGDEVEGDFA